MLGLTPTELECEYRKCDFGVCADSHAETLACVALNLGLSVSRWHKSGPHTPVQGQRTWCGDQEDSGLGPAQDSSRLPELPGRGLGPPGLVGRDKGRAGAVVCW